MIGQGEVVRLSAKRIATQNTHGTGCTLSSAIAAGLAKGRDLVAATQDAKAYVTAAIAAADRLQVGHGHGPLNHFYEQMEHVMTTRRNFTIGLPPPPASSPRRPSRARKR